MRPGESAYENDEPVFGSNVGDVDEWEWVRDECGGFKWPAWVLAGAIVVFVLVLLWMASRRKAQAGSVR